MNDIGYKLTSMGTETLRVNLPSNCELDPKVGVLLPDRLVWGKIKTMATGRTFIAIELTAALARALADAQAQFQHARAARDLRPRVERQMNQPRERLPNAPPQRADDAERNAAE